MGLRSRVNNHTHTHTHTHSTRTRAFHALAISYYLSIDTFVLTRKNRLVLCRKKKKLIYFFPPARNRRTPRHRHHQGPHADARPRRWTHGRRAWVLTRTKRKTIGARSSAVAKLAITPRAGTLPPRDGSQTPLIRSIRAVLCCVVWFCVVWFGAV